MKKIAADRNYRLMKEGAAFVPLYDIPTFFKNWKAADFGMGGGSVPILQEGWKKVSDGMEAMAVSITLLGLHGNMNKKFGAPLDFGDLHAKAYNNLKQAVRVSGASEDGSEK